MHGRPPKFWMIFDASTNTPRRYYDNRREAMEAAKALATLRPEHRIHLLEGQGYVVKLPSGINECIV